MCVFSSELSMKRELFLLWLMPVGLAERLKAEQRKGEEKRAEERRGEHRRKGRVSFMH